MQTQILSSKMKFFRGRIKQIGFKSHRNDFGRRIFTKPRNKKNRFDPFEVDNYIGEIRIKVCFEDGDIKYYTPDRLLERIKMSKKIFIDERKKNFVRGWVEKSNIEAELNLSSLGEKVVINDVKYYLSTDFSEENYPHVLFDTNGNLVGIYDEELGEILEAEWDSDEE